MHLSALHLTAAHISPLAALMAGRLSGGLAVTRHTRLRRFSILIGELNSEHVLAAPENLALAAAIQTAGHFQDDFVRYRIGP
jgi:hypothetical protein